MFPPAGQTFLFVFLQTLTEQHGRRSPPAAATPSIWHSLAQKCAQTTGMLRLMLVCPVAATTRTPGSDYVWSASDPSNPTLPFSFYHSSSWIVYFLLVAPSFCFNPACWDLLRRTITNILGTMSGLECDPAGWNLSICFQVWVSVMSQHHKETLQAGFGKQSNAKSSSLIGPQCHCNSWI